MRKERDAERLRLCACRRNVSRAADVMAQTVSQAFGIVREVLRTETKEEKQAAKNQPLSLSTFCATHYDP